MEATALPTISAPDSWDRYYQVATDLEPILETPGLPDLAIGDTLADGQLVQMVDRGFFLRAESPLSQDPVELSAALAGLPAAAGAFASVSGPRRRRVSRTATGTHVDVEQLVRGARVVGSDVRVHHDDRGVFAVTGRPIGDLQERDPGPPPELAEHEAIDTCAQRFDLEDGLREARVEQVVFPEGAGAVWAYELAFVVLAHSADVRTYLRADDLSLLLSYNVSSAAQGTAEVYPLNPMDTPNLTQVTLEDLDAPGDLLRGPALDVSQASGARLDRNDSDFRVDPGDPAFDEGQVYHLLWGAKEYFAGIADPALLQATPFTPMVALVNDPQSPNNAYFMPSTGQLRFGLFGSRSGARSASIVTHEFGHAITDSICRLGRAKVRNTESRGLSEGYSDYFAASSLDDPRFGSFVANDPNGARNCSDSNLQFASGFTGEEHATGAVWAAVLWAIRGQLGLATTDMLAIESIEFLDSSSTFEDARTALHSVDQKLNGSANQSVIDSEFDARTAP